MKNPFSCSRVAHTRGHTHTQADRQRGGRKDGRKDRQRQTGMTKRIVAFRSFAKEPKRTEVEWKHSIN